MNVNLDLERCPREDCFMIYGQSLLGYSQSKDIFMRVRLKKEVSVSCFSIPPTGMIKPVVKRGKAMETKKRRKGERWGRRALTL